MQCKKKQKTLYVKDAMSNFQYEHRTQHNDYGVKDSHQTSLFDGCNAFDDMNDKQKSSRESQ